MNKKSPHTLFSLKKLDVSKDHLVAEGVVTFGREHDEQVAMNSSKNGEGLLSSFQRNQDAFHRVLTAQRFSPLKKAKKIPRNRSQTFPSYRVLYSSLYEDGNQLHSEKSPLISPQHVAPEGQKTNLSLDEPLIPDVPHQHIQTLLETSSEMTDDKKQPLTFKNGKKERNRSDNPKILPSGRFSQESDIPKFHDLTRQSSHQTSLPQTYQILNDSLEGAIVAERFEIQKVLGKGGMGTVYLARQRGLERPVALKLINAKISANEIQKERFRREARAMTRFSHPNAITVYDFGEWNGQLFIAMEYIEGRSLHDIIVHHYPFTDRYIVDVLSQVCDVLEAAHDANILHRDLKPENIMILKKDDGSEFIKLVDFGLALLTGSEGQQRLTQEGMMVGTPSHLSPEQAQGHELDERSDIYSLGIILYEMLTGTLPFTGNNVMAIIMQQMLSPPVPPSKRFPNKTFSPVLENLTLQALSKSPKERPQSASEFKEILKSAIGESSANVTLPKTRQERADVIGMPYLENQNSVAVKLPKHAILVIEEEKPSMQSIIIGIWGNGFKARRVPDLEQAAKVFDKLSKELVTPLVFDITPAPESALQELSSFLQDHPVPTIVVGPHDDFELMQKALEMGIFDYITDPIKKLPSSLRKLIRRQAKKLKRN